MTLRIAGIVDESIVDGPGVRTTVFVQGCPHHCEGCHNAHTFDFSGGRDIDVDDLARRIGLNEEICGATFSGGEPFCQASALAYLAQRIKKYNKSIVIYTGYTFEQLLQENDAHRMALLAQADILIDGPFVQSQKDLTLKFRGSKNQRILDCPASLFQGKAILLD